MGPFTVGDIPNTPQVFQIDNDDLTPRDLSVYDSITMNMSDPNGDGVEQTWTTEAYDPTHVGRIVVVWSPTDNSPFMLTGTYRVQIEMVASDGTSDSSAIATFDVEPVMGADPTPFSWASLGDVTAITGVSVSALEIAQAQSIIDLVTNRTPAASASMRLRDIEWLKRAVCYQAVWIDAQPDLFTRSSMLEVAQDAVTGKYASKASIYLAPLAERALKNVSWLRSRSLRVRTPFIDGDTDIYISPEANDLLENWTPLGMLQ